MSASLSHPTVPQDGFVQIPRFLFDQILYLDLSKREVKILLLVARLTFGCRDASWTRLSPADLAAIGITPNNASIALKLLLTRGLLIQHEEHRAYRLSEIEFAQLTGEEASRKEQLVLAVGMRLRRSSRIEKPRTQNENPNFLNLSRSVFSNQERYPSQNEKVSAGSHWTFCAPKKQFVRMEEAGIDSIKTSIDKDKQGSFTQRLDKPCLTETTPDIQATSVQFRNEHL